MQQRLVQMSRQVFNFGPTKESPVFALSLGCVDAAGEINCQTASVSAGVCSCTCLPAVAPQLLPRRWWLLSVWRLRPNVCTALQDMLVHQRRSEVARWPGFSDAAFVRLSELKERKKARNSKSKRRWIQQEA